MLHLNNMRYEIKIPLEEIPLYEIKKLVNINPFCFRKTFPSRRVNNLYFDNFDLNDFQSHIDGAFFRKKIRLRWYGQLIDFTSSNLEIKSKFGNLGSKESFPILNAFNLNNSFQEIIKEILWQVPENQTIMLQNYQPVIINYYQREYYESLKNEIRLTIDYDLKTFDQRFAIKPNISFAEPDHDFIIIEIKSSMEKYSILSEVLSSFSSTSYRFSKFINGMMSVFSR